MGAGIVECDVTFTAEGELVCRHAECDLHTTTNILVTPLADKCEVKWTGPNQSPAPRCCTSALTLPEFRSLRGKMDSANPAATTVEGYLGGNPTWRTELYTGRGTLVTLEESIKLNQKNGVKHTPELKEGDAQRIAAVFGGQDEYAQKLADTLSANGVRRRDAWPQSFNVNDVLYWVKNTRYGEQAVFLIDYDAAKDDIILRDETGTPVPPADRPAFFTKLKQAGVNIIAPAMPALLAVTDNGQIVPSQFARDLKAWNFDIITWTFERSDVRQGASKAGFYFDFDPQGKAVKKDSDIYKALDVLARRVRILGIFSDWPATVTYYANCMGLK
jgi:glycerophosphoryl diester phosphodiesterase